jgi:hypothetical protein
LNPVENFERLLNIIITVQTVSTLCTPRFEQAISTLPGAKRGGVDPAKPGKFTDGVRHEGDLKREDSPNIL